MRKGFKFVTAAHAFLFSCSTFGCGVRAWWDSAPWALEKAPIFCALTLTALAVWLVLDYVERRAP